MNINKYIDFGKTEGVDNFINQIDSRYKISDELKDFLIDFIQNSECKKIEFVGFKHQALGLSLHDGVLINKLVLNRGLDFLLFIIFHEIAHQYQFKKYGEDKMYECYIGDISVDDAAKFMKTTEEVADEYASRKFNELVKKKIINSDFVPPQIYKNVPIGQIRMMVDNYRKEMKSKDITTSEKISEYFYKMVKS
jgi:hypothetical protein